MYLIKTEAAFDSAHFLSGYNGKCGNIHGHRWKLVAEISRDTLSTDPQNSGMIVDFSQFKGDLQSLADSLDHCLIIEEGTLKAKTYEALCEEGFKIVSLPFRPTAENLAKYVYDSLESLGYTVSRAIVYETPKNCAVYSKSGEVTYEL